MGGIWERIRQLGVCEPAGLAPPYTSVLRTTDPSHAGHWLVGPHPLLSKLANQLRSDKDLFEMLRTGGVQFGFRAEDNPPFGKKRQKSYGTAVLKSVLDHSDERTHADHQRLSKCETPPRARLGDELANVWTYWTTQTPQAHHIVEFNNLEDAGVSRLVGADDLDYDGLPCVLLIAEFHQRFISSVLKSTHSAGGSAAQTLAWLRPVYEELYRERVPELATLWSISKIILDVAALKIPGTTIC